MRCTADRLVTPSGLNLPLLHQSPSAWYLSDQLHIEKIPLCLRLQGLELRLVDLLRRAYGKVFGTGEFAIRFEDQMLLDDGLGLHSSDASEDVEDLAVSRGGYLAEEQELVHLCGCFAGVENEVLTRSECLELECACGGEVAVKPSWNAVGLKH